MRQPRDRWPRVSIPRRDAPESAAIPAAARRSRGVPRVRSDCRSWTGVWCALALLLVSVAPAAGAQAAPYTIGPQDVLSVTVFNQAELTGKFQVAADGAVALPIIGRLSAAGLTLLQFEAMLAKRLSETILRNPQVSVTVDTFRSQQFFVIGEVRQPGAYFLSGHETLIQAIARAGYTTAEAGGDVLIVRPSRQGQSAPAGPVQPDQVGDGDIVRVDLDKLATGSLEGNVAVQDGDTILVAKAESVFVLGQVNAPGAYRLKRNLTVVQLISMAGGLTDRGTTRRLKVTRLVNGKKQDLKIELDAIVLANDTITVAEKWF